jgi:hypothetical protein
MALTSSMDMRRPQISFDDLEVTLNLGRRSSRDYIAIVQNGNPIGYRHDQIHVVFNQQDGNARAPERMNDLNQAGNLFLHKSGRGFVKQQSRGRVASARAISSSLR